jgi:hypothetical protein
VSRYLLSQDSVIGLAKELPYTLADLDFREPDFRQAMVEAFRNCPGESDQASVLGYLARTAGDGVAPPAGAPGSPEQAAAHLQLLDALEPFCNSILLKQSLAEARASLQKLVHRP